MTDPISDMLNRIRNAQAVLNPTVSVPFSSFKYEIAKILEKEGLTGRIEKKGRDVKKTIEIILKYNKNTDPKEGQKLVPAISGLKRVSKPGQRIYAPYKNVKRVRNGFGMSIISTPKGLLTDKEARKQKTGGEIICEIW